METVYNLFDLFLVLLALGFAWFAVEFVSTMIGLVFIGLLSLIYYAWLLITGKK